MQFPFSIPFGSEKIMLHTILETAGYFIGFRYFLYLRRRQGDTISSPKRIWIIIAAIFGSVAGSRLIGGLEDIAGLQAAFNKPLYFYQNKTVLGGFLGGLLAVELVKKIIREKHSSGDLFTYPMILALMIGRIGCFSMGVYEETYGVQTTLPWGIDLGDKIFRHPVCLYEIVYLGLVWLTIATIEGKFILADGAKYKMFMISYCFFRFMLDFIKPHYTFSIGLSTIQVTALLGLIYYADEIIHPGKLLESIRLKKIPAVAEGV